MPVGVSKSTANNRPTRTRHTAGSTDISRCDTSTTDDSTTVNTSNIGDKCSDRSNIGDKCSDRSEFCDRVSRYINSDATIAVSSSWVKKTKKEQRKDEKERKNHNTSRGDQTIVLSDSLVKTLPPECIERLLNKESKKGDGGIVGDGVIAGDNKSGVTLEKMSMSSYIKNRSADISMYVVRSGTRKSSKTFKAREACTKMIENISNLTIRDETRDDAEVRGDEVGSGSDSGLSDSGLNYEVGILDEGVERYGKGSCFICLFF